MDNLNVKEKDVVQNENKPFKNFKVLKIITAVLYVVATAFVVWFMVDIATAPENLGTAFAIIAWFAIAIPTLAVPLIVSLVGLILSAMNKKRSQCTLGSVIYFAVFTALPIITFLICILVFNLVF
ncbi:MAG: hypothetical protein IJX03_01995 [Clostridia bacterium]|nr:hypothetical protein [Clostridia bacterium]